MRRSLGGTMLPTLFSNYIVEDFIGKGAFGQVVRCFKPATNKKVAVKITRNYTVQQAEEEEVILRKLKDFNPDTFNIIRWKRSFIVQSYYFCQEFELLDISLKQFLYGKETPLQLSEIRPVLSQMATALMALKNLGIIHSDLKLENIMLVDHVRQPLNVKLIDFSCAFQTCNAQQGSCIQDWSYRAPETIIALPFNEAIDMWSLGCIAAELFLGFPLYLGIYEYDIIWNITQTQGELPKHLLNAGLKTRNFYLEFWPNIWRLMTPQEYGISSLNGYGFRSLDYLKKFRRTPISCLSQADNMADKADLDNFVVLIKEMLQQDPAERINPAQVLQHPFITMSHLVGFLKSSSHVKLCFDLMSIYCPQAKNPVVHSGDVASPTFSLEVRSLQEESYRKSVQSDRNPFNPLLKRKRIVDDGSRKFINSGPPLKKRRICEERPSSLSSSSSSLTKICAMKRTYDQMTGCRTDNSRSPTSRSPSQKKMVISAISSSSPGRRLCGHECAIKRTYDEISTCGNEISLNRRSMSRSPVRKKMRIYKEERSSSSSSLGSNLCAQECTMKSRHVQTSPCDDDISESLSPERKRIDDDNRRCSTSRSPTRKKTIYKEDSSSSSSSSSSLGSNLFAQECTMKSKHVQTSPCDNEISESLSSRRKIKIKRITFMEDKDLTVGPSTSKDIPSTSNTMPTENEDEKVPKIWLIGSSYIKRAESSAYKNFGENFGLNAEVKWFGKGRMRWSEVLPRFYAELYTQSPPDILVVHAGGNDLGLVFAGELASQMQEDLTQLHEEFPSMTIAYSCINERQVWRYGAPRWINNDRKAVNRAMRRAADSFGGVVIEHYHLKYYDNSIFLSDGVNFTRDGNEIFVTSIRDVIEKILQRQTP